MKPHHAIRGGLVMFMLFGTVFARQTDSLAASTVSSQAAKQTQQPLQPATPNGSGSVVPAQAVSNPANRSSKIEIPSGTHIPLVLHNAVSTRSVQPGDPVYFETSFPVMLNGKIIVPAGSWVSGEVT